MQIIGESPSSSYKMTLKQQLNSQKRMKNETES